MQEQQRYQFAQQLVVERRKNCCSFPAVAVAVFLSVPSIVAPFVAIDAPIPVLSPSVDATVVPTFVLLIHALLFVAAATIEAYPASLVAQTDDAPPVIELALVSPL
ncbi:hypothetical protein D3C80_1958730 [compost metagenome]